MTEEKKNKIRKRIFAIQMCFVGLFAGYLIYGIVSKHLNTAVFNGLMILMLVMSILLCDIVQPYLTEEFENFTPYRKEAYGKFLLWDIGAMAGILALVMTIAGGSMPLVAIIGLMLFSTGTKKKRTYYDAFIGRITEESVEAAKLAAAEEEAQSDGSV